MYKTKILKFLGLVAILSLILACGDLEPLVEYESVDSGSVNSPTLQVPQAEAESEPAQPAVQGEAGTWLVMMYQNADDEILENDIYIDLNEAEMVGSSKQVTIVSQIDRYDGAFYGDGDWTNARRYLVERDDDLQRVNSTLLQDLDEVDSGSWKTLVDFADWAISNYPAEKYVLILSDHGAGWTGGWNDDQPVEGSFMTVNDIDRALGQILADTGIGQFELVGYDACLMSHLEPIFATAPHARYMVASQETEPALGWAYSSFLADLTANPEMSGAELSRKIVDSYIVGDGRITNDLARNAFVEEIFGYQVSQEELAEEMSDNITLAAIDLSKVPAINEALNNLLLTINRLDQGLVAEARTYAQSFESVFGEDNPSPFIDLGHFASLLQEGLPNDAPLDGAVEQLNQSFQSALVAERHGPSLPASSGFAIYFPVSSLYRQTISENSFLHYTLTASRFALASLWDDFLLYHYTGQSFSAAVADAGVLNPRQAVEAMTAPPAPEGEMQLSAPGSSEITIAPLQLSSDIVDLDGVITVSTQVTGGNVAYIYLYTIYFDPQYDAFLTANMDFVGSDDTREINGVFYPDWGEGAVLELEVDWDATIYYISDGNEEDDQFAYFKPEVYGATAEEDIYAVRGIYTFQDSGQERSAIMRFGGGDGMMKSIYGFSDDNFTGAPREIIPRSGDNFTILEEWLEFDENPDGEFVDYPGGVITFGNRRLEMVPYYAYTGDYIIGIIVEDLDGKTYAEFSQVTVTE